ncbi:hypothetical protein ACMG0D_001505 [Campylobacter jejuni]
MHGILAGSTLLAPNALMAMGGPSGVKIDWQIQGQMGMIKMNPYWIVSFDRYYHE